MQYATLAELNPKAAAAASGGEGEGTATGEGEGVGEKEGVTGGGESDKAMTSSTFVWKKQLVSLLCIGKWSAYQGVFLTIVCVD